MPDDPIVWIVAIIAAGLVALLALWKGQFVEIELNPPKLRFKRRQDGDGGISVGAGLTVEGSRTGDIAGMKLEGGGAAAVAPEGPVSVAAGARIAGSSTGDIAGVKQTGGAAPAASRDDTH